MNCIAGAKENSCDPIDLLGFQTLLTVGIYAYRKYILIYLHLLKSEKWGQWEQTRLKRPHSVIIKTWMKGRSKSTLLSKSGSVLLKCTFVRHCYKVTDDLHYIFLKLCILQQSDHIAVLLQTLQIQLNTYLQATVRVVFLC